MPWPSLACRLALRGSRSLPRIADVCSLACERISHVWAGGQRRGRRASRAPIARDAPRCVSRALPSPWIAHAITGTRVSCTAFDRGKPVRRVLARDGAEDALASFARDPPNTAKGRALAEAEARECSVEAPSRPRKREGRPDRSGRPSLRVTGWRQPVDRSRDHGHTRELHRVRQAAGARSRRVTEGKPVFFWPLSCLSCGQKKLGGRIGVPREGSPKPRR